VSKYIIEFYLENLAPEGFQRRLSIQEIENGIFGRPRQPWNL